MSTPDTKERILQAAKELFAEKGFPGTSMREITSRAEVNLAAINYHFGSKEGLLLALVRRCLEPINKERLESLQRAEARAEASGTTVPLREVIQAFLEPAVRQFTETEPDMPCILARMHHEPHSGLEDALAEILEPVIQRFVAAVQTALPDRKPAEIILRGHFMIGALLHLLDTSRTFLSSISEGMVDVDDTEFMLEQLVNFCTAGFQNA
ncbi:MAG: TetR/AcrR family transcriptional regulator [Planctomycetota bacterium]|jgi:AcrR family transcriptional regulator